MDIRNIRSLDANTYDFINISKNVNVRQEKNAFGYSTVSDNLRYEQVGTRFTSTLKGLSDEEKVTEIIRYFLRNNIICEISDYLSSDYFLIKSLGDRTLKISRNHVLSKEVLDEIYFKYYCDRGKMIDTSTCDNYIFGSSESWCECMKVTPGDDYFMIPIVMHNEEVTNVVFKENDKDLSDIDKRFYEQVISDLFGDFECEIYEYYKFYMIRRKDGRNINILTQTDNSNYMDDVIKEYIKISRERKIEKVLLKKMEEFI